MQTWFGFYSVMGGATATLLGLLFVAVSINAAAILGDANGSLERLAEQAFQNYLAVLAVSLLAIFPTLDISTFGLVTLAVIASWSVWVLIRLYRTAIQPQARGERVRMLRRQSASLIGFAILVVTATRMALGWGVSLSWFAAGTIVLLLSATAVSWNLLLRVARAERE